MTPCFAPTLDDLLADPLVQTLMSADHVDATRLRRQMTQTAAQIARRGGLDLSGARLRVGTEPRARDVAGRKSRLCG